MTMKEWMKNATYEEQKDFANKLHSWLGTYTQEVIEHVMNQIDDIINNEHVMKMITELHERMQKEEREEKEHFFYNLKNIEEGDNDYFTVHAHVLTHSNSYRDVLYDMFIRDR